MKCTSLIPCRNLSQQLAVMSDTEVPDTEVPDEKNINMIEIELILGDVRGYISWKRMPADI